MKRPYWNEKQDQAFEHFCDEFASTGYVVIGDVVIDKEEALADMASLSGENGIEKLLLAVVSNVRPSTCELIARMNKVKDDYIAKTDDMIAQAVTDNVE